MTDSSIDVFILLTGANEGSTPLEAAKEIEAADIDVTVCEFFEESDEPRFGVDVLTIRAESKYDFAAYRRLYDELDSREPDILHVHPNAIGSVARVIAQFTPVSSIVTTEHSNHEARGTLTNIVNGVTNCLSDVVVSNSYSTQRSFARWEDVLLAASGTDKTVVHYGADINAINDQAENGDVPPLPDGFLIGTGSRLIWEKNLGSLIRAASNLVYEHDDIHVVIAGDGPKRSQLEELADSLGIKSNVHFLGWLTERTDVYAFFDELDVFAFPSHYEGFGVANVEAMALGTPVVVNDIPVLREAVGDAGVFVDANDVAEFTHVLEDLYLHPEKRRRLGAAAAERIKTRFPLERTVRKYNTVYRTWT